MSLTFQPYLEYIHADGRAHEVAGDVRIIPAFPMPQLDTTRPVVVYLPPGYAASRRSYPVLYMQDGQNLFDHLTAFAGQDWRVDETLEELSAEGLPAIVAGIYHGDSARLVEYNPFPGRWPSRGSDYVRFLCETLKPFLDTTFRTDPSPGATGIIGSSMGALISLYSFLTRPDVFGLCGALSPSLFVAHGAILRYAAEAPFNRGKIYLDHGTHEPSARPLYDVLRIRGYTVPRHLKFVAERGGKHSEDAWARRLPDALRYLLQAQRPAYPRGRSDLSLARRRVR